MAAQVAIVRTKLLAFLNGFGNNIEDVLLEVKDNRVYGAVDVSTHYCCKSISVVLSNQLAYRPGKIYISDIDKVTTFLKASSQDLCILNQWEASFNLKLGSDSLQIPSHTHIRSALTLARANEAVTQMIASNFTKIGPAILQVNGSVNMEKLRGLGVAVKVAGKDAPCRIKVTPCDSEMVVTVGHIVGGANVNRVIELGNVWGEGEVITHFGSHLPNTLACMDSGVVDFYIGGNAALVIQHQERDTLLILKHQQGVNA
jgi:hypothetical protein